MCVLIILVYIIGWVHICTQLHTIAYSLITIDTDHRPRVSRKALNRWMVAYTLLRNPSLQQLTASRLAESVTAVDSESFNWKDAYVSDYKIMAEF